MSVHLPALPAPPLPPLPRPTHGDLHFSLTGVFIEHQFNLSLRTSGEKIGKWVLLMSGVGTLREVVVTDKATKLKIRIRMWPTVA